MSKKDHVTSGNAEAEAMKNISALQASGFSEEQARVLVQITSGIIGATIKPTVERIDRRFERMEQKMDAHARVSDEKTEAINKMTEVYAKTSDEKIRMMNKMMEAYAKASSENTKATNKAMDAHIKTSISQMQTLGGKIDWMQKALLASSLGLTAVFFTVIAFFSEL